ncbi:MAG: ATP-binding protein [Desulfobacterales bacterium]|nr:ATP-binding protein [Desulfobacterales bacterium]
MILFSVMGFFTYYQTIRQIKFHTAEQESRALNISNIVMRSIEYPMLDGEMEYVQKILEDLNEAEELHRIILCDWNGIIKHAGHADLIGSSINSEITKRSLQSNSLVNGFEYYGKEKVISHAMPIRNEKACNKCHGTERNMLGVLSVGISWSPTEKRIIALRNREIAGTLILMGAVGFFLALWFSRYITRPISRLTSMADLASHGKSKIQFGKIIKCWEESDCYKTECPAYGGTDIPCWFVQNTLCWSEPSGKFPEKVEECIKCKIYKKYSGDEIMCLADSFKHMLYRLNQSERELIISERKYRDLFNSDPNPIFIVDGRTFAILDVNETAQGYYGYSREEFLQKSFFDLSSRPCKDIIDDFASIKEGQTLLYFKRQHCRKDKGFFYVNIHVCTAEYMKRNALIITTSDVTESVEKEAQLIQASKMSALGTMASGIAHELNQPLNVIKVGSDFFIKMIDRGESIDKETFRSMAEEMSRYVDRASEIINHMREFARASDVSRSEVNINKPIADVFKVLNQQLILHQIDIELDLAKNLPPILADHNRLEQVFINLITNARDALEERGKTWKKILKVRTFAEDKHVVAIVSDNGKGIPADIIDKIFEPFLTTKEIGAGTGLGLSISYEIVKDYGGEIAVESKEDVGTSFKVTFPAISGKSV